MSGEAGPEKGINRRAFLAWSAGGLGALIGAVLGGAGLSYFVSPAFRDKEEDWVDLGPVGAFPKGVPTKIEFVERRRDAWVTTERRSSAWVLAEGAAYVAYDPRCTHLGCPYRWDDVKKEFLCPCHTAIFTMHGEVQSGPAPRPLDRYPVKVAGGRLLILPKAVEKKA